MYLSVHSGQRRRPPDQRPWRKLHLAVDRQSGDITACELKASTAHDSTLVPKLLEHSGRPLRSLTADGAYDSERVYKALARNARRRARPMPRVLIPPRKGAKPSRRRSTAMMQRNRTLRNIGRSGRRAWHKTSGYTRHSRVENVNYRYKATFGSRMRTRSLSGQRLEARLGCRILNTMAELGRPESPIAD